MNTTRKMIFQTPSTEGFKFENLKLCTSFNALASYSARADSLQEYYHKCIRLLGWVKMREREKFSMKVMYQMKR